MEGRQEEEEDPPGKASAMGNAGSMDSQQTDFRAHNVPLKLPMPEPAELEERFAVVLVSKAAQPPLPFPLWGPPAWAIAGRERKRRRRKERRGLGWLAGSLLPPSLALSNPFQGDQRGTS